MREEESQEMGTCINPPCLPTTLNTAPRDSPPHPTLRTGVLGGMHVENIVSVGKDHIGVSQLVEGPPYSNYWVNYDFELRKLSSFLVPGHWQLLSVMSRVPRAKVAFQVRVH